MYLTVNNPAGSVVQMLLFQNRKHNWPWRKNRRMGAQLVPRNRLAKRCDRVARHCQQARQPISSPGSTSGHLFRWLCQLISAARGRSIFSRMPATAEAGDAELVVAHLADCQEKEGRAFR